MRQLIVNADDFGFSPQVNEGVCEAFVHGIVTDASLLVYSPHAPHAIQLAKSAGFTIGVHVDLVTSYIPTQSSLLGSEGELVRELFRREYEKQPGVPFSCDQLISLRNEIRNQVDRFVQMTGRLPTHLDYHFGLHYLPEVMAMYLTVAEEYQLPARWGSQYAGKNPYSRSPDKLCDQFRGVDTGGTDLFLDLVRKPWEGLLEMMCHPGYFTPDGLLDTYNRERENELRALTQPRLKSELDKLGIELVNYDWLKTAAGG